MSYACADEFDELGSDCRLLVRDYLGGDVLARDLYLFYILSCLVLGLFLEADFLVWVCFHWSFSCWVGWVGLSLGWVGDHGWVVGWEFSWVWVFSKFLPGLGALGGLGLGLFS